jgi:wyosine [tRNA(Phe)-imidazoG37] synthetase (radical SAM superfamily)
MSGFLFEHIIFGPVRSRRLGISLGINLLPEGIKHCTFNCLYCECGWTVVPGDKPLTWPPREVVRRQLENRLSAMATRKALLTNITFAGNGEPTLHPDFPGIIDDAIVLRDRHYPDAGISVLSNASTAGDDAIAGALLKVDQNILKLDAGTEETFRRINQPQIPLSLQQVLENLERFRGQMILQTLFVRGILNGQAFDNTTEEELAHWLGHLDRLRPRSVMIYPVARATPAEDVRKVPQEELLDIARRVEALGIPAEVYG